MLALLSLIRSSWTQSHRITKCGIFLGLSIFLSLNESYASHLKLRIGYNENSSYPHFLEVGPLPATPPGLSVDIIKIIADELEFDIEFVRLPGRRVLHELKANRLDAAFIFSFKPERQQFGVYPMIGETPDSERRLAVLSYVLYKNQGSDLNWNGEIFENLRGAIGANAGYSIVADLRKKGVIVEEAKSTSNNFAKLRSSRVVAVADQEVVADAYLRKNKLNGVVKLLKPLVTKDYFLIFSHKFSSEHSETKDAVWNAIAEKRDELTEQLIPKYLDGDLQRSPSN
ncbi:substrate-binding periplasmic protein [Kiloniella sp.]|uniref:substrate-binding periplasmic protein n=1 Tax=Kiloniella sp. TaxID=1938587 RepID=UPI003B01D088